MPPRPPFFFARVRRLTHFICCHGDESMDDAYSRKPTSLPTKNQNAYFYVFIFLLSFVVGFFLVCPFSCVGRSTNTIPRAQQRPPPYILCIFVFAFCRVPGNRPLSARRARRTTRSRRRASPRCGRSRRVRRALAAALRAACASRRDLSPGTPPQAAAPGF